MAAPSDVLSLWAASPTGMPVTSALICRQTALFAPPPRLRICVTLLAK